MTESTSILVGNGSSVHVVLFISDKILLISIAVTGQNFKSFRLIGSRFVSIGGQNNSGNSSRMTSIFVLK